ncbi:unnamed protein product (macronuclear) [Paramecium tetraurelia]|uniref:Uncharacterized protein n=1 Tax=Paramecium tetraurelia TaxID=5888 RepID=A0C3M6_PARTE|nr:uncharacterized protein GSPATT00034872001 [Paramecium tetraurelia]CAK65393.1 unnamed protein product [Paramecium tetraurelia]|eukprot:XP_001432790.1 hypothetical protein (macronuclear) [Paramecium tetraurelia strain d4-2]
MKSMLHIMQKRGSVVLMEPINDGMDKVQDKHQVVQTYVEQVNPKTAIAIEKEEERLNQRYFHLMNQLERLKYQILKLEEKKKSQEDLENHPSVKEVVGELHKISTYEKALSENHSKMVDEIKLNKMTINQLKQTVYQKRIEIRDVVRDSFRIQEDMIKIRQEKRTVSIDRNSVDMFLTIPETSIPKPQILPSLPLKQKSKSTLLHIMKNVQSENQQEKINDIVYIYRQVQELRSKTQQSTRFIQKMTNRYCQIRGLLSECASISIQSFKNKQKITNKNGYANSIYFDVSTLNNSKNESSIIKERKIQNILYDTLQQIMIDLIDSQQKTDLNGSSIADSIIRNSVSQEQFMQFTSVQILGLMALQPRLITELLGIFELKQKQVGLLCNKTRQLSKQLEVV